MPGMPLMPCPACALRVSTEAMTCPRCGHGLRAVLIEQTAKHWKRWILIGIGMSMAGGALAPWYRSVGGGLFLAGFVTAIGAKLQAWWENG